MHRPGACPACDWVWRQWAVGTGGRLQMHAQRHGCAGGGVTLDCSNVALAAGASGAASLFAAQELLGK
jgi:hypothetical protein